MLKMEFIVTNCSKIRLLIYHFVVFFLLFFGKEVFWFLCFVADFRKVPKHFFLVLILMKAFQQCSSKCVFFIL